MNGLKSTGYKLSDDPIIRFCAFYAFLYLGSLLLGGYGIFSIVFGLMIFSTRILIRTSFGQSYIKKFFGYKQPEQIINQPHSTMYKIAMSIINLIMFGFYTATSILFIWLGIKFLIESGFLNQNLIYLIFFKFK
jgi:hypothetical protein